MASLSLHHAGRTVSDMEASLRFYRDLLGLKVVVDDDVLAGEEISQMIGIEGAELRAVFLSADGQLPFMELIEYRAPQGRPLSGNERTNDIGATHPCILVDDVQAEYERLQAAGVEFAGPPLYADAGVFKGQWAAYCLDPDGQPVELWSISD